MGFKKNWDVANVAKQINIARMECTAYQNDGFTQWSAKQDLYKIKWIVEDAIRHCPHFSFEKEWLKEQEQKQIIDILKETYNP
jgi:hypothetical protein